MSESALTINFSAPQLPPPVIAFVQLEQEPVDENLNYLTKLQAANALNYFVSGGPVPSDYCSEGFSSKIVYAYPYPSDLTYQIRVSKGSSSQTGARLLMIEETINSNLNDILSTQYPVKEIIEYEWTGPTYDEYGNEQPHPILTLNGPDIGMSYKVFGTVKVVYQTVQDTITIAIAYNNVVVEGETLDPYLLCIWSGGHEDLKLKFVDGEESITCNNSISGSGGGGFDSNNDPGYVDGEDEIHNFDYCTGEELTNG